MGLSLKGLGKSISKAFKGVGKTLQKAAPVLIPLAVAGVTGGFGSGGWLGQIGKSVLGGSNLGAIGKNLLGSLAKTGIAKTTVDGALTADSVAQEPSKQGSSNFIGAFLEKAAPTFLTQLIDGKPKSASKEASRLYSGAPVMTPAQAELATFMGANLKDNYNNQPTISPLSTNERGPINFSAPMQAGPLTPIAPAGTQTGGVVGAYSAPINFSGVPEEGSVRGPRAFAVRRRGL